MTEQEWLASEDPEQMLLSLRGKSSDRKLRLFAVTCVRQGSLARWGNESVADEVTMAERYAEGEVTYAELRNAIGSRDLLLNEGYAPLAQGEPFPAGVAARVAHEAAAEAASAATTCTAAPAAWQAARIVQCRLLRDLFGPLPFREVRIATAWLTPAVSSIARRAYDERDFAALPVLADALADANCDDEDLLRHCRERGLVHCRGCWALDLILGKG